MATTEIYTLSLHDALPISGTVFLHGAAGGMGTALTELCQLENAVVIAAAGSDAKCDFVRQRSEEHTSELQSLTNLVCRLLLEKKKKNNRNEQHNKDQSAIH